MRLIFPVMVAVVLAAGDPPQDGKKQDVNKEDAIKKDLALFEGEWAMVSGMKNGLITPKAFVITGKLVAKDGEVTVRIIKQLFFKAKYTIDPTKTPKAVDYLVTDGPDKGKKQLGIYELGEDMAKFCSAAPGQERPTEFSAKADSKRTLSVWKRSKK